MSFVAEKKKCSKCGRLYSWNPDVGKIQCPCCKKKRRKGELEKPDLKSPMYSIYELNLLKGGK